MAEGNKAEPFHSHWPCSFTKHLCSTPSTTVLYVILTSTSKCLA